MKPTPQTCVDLLRQDLDREKRRTAPTQPYPLPYPVPYPVAPRPYIPNPYSWRQLPYTVSQPNTAGAAGTGLRAIQVSFTGDATNLH